MNNYAYLRNYLRSPDRRKKEMALFTLSFTDYRPLKYLPVEMSNVTCLKNIMLKTGKLGDNITDEESGSVELRKLYKVLAGVDGCKDESVDEKQKRLFESWMKEWGFDLDFNSRRLIIFIKQLKRQPDGKDVDENFLHRVLLDRRRRGGEAWDRISGSGVELKFRNARR